MNKKKEYDDFFEESSSEESSSLSLSMSMSNLIYDELISRRLDDVPQKLRLSNTDVKRICKYVKKSLFGDECTIWEGYVTNSNNSSKGPYVNFYHNGKKIALHRLLYSNYVSKLTEDEYIKFRCDNKGYCCNVNHYEKYKYRNRTPNGDKVNKKKKKIDDVVMYHGDIVIDFE